MSYYGNYSSAYPRYYGAVNYRGAEGTWDAVNIARSTGAYIDEEAGLPSLFAQFSMGRSFNWVAGLSSIVDKRAKSKCCTGWENLLGLPNPQFVLQWTKDAQAAAIEGITSTVGSAGGGLPILKSQPPGQTAHKMMYWYADVITNREEEWARVMEKLQAGQLPLTPTEEEAQLLLEKWVTMFNAGGSQREAALAEAGTRVSGGNVLIRVDTDLVVPPSYQPYTPSSQLTYTHPSQVATDTPYVVPTFDPTGGRVNLNGLTMDSLNGKRKLTPFLVVAATGVGVYLFRDQIKTIFTRTR